MSNLLVQNIKHTNNTTAATVSSSGGVAVAGTLAVTGVHTVGNNAIHTSDGGAVTQNLVQGLCKSWIQFNGSSFSTQDSLNRATLTDNGTGNYTLGFTNNMNNDDFSVTTGTKTHEEMIEALATGTVQILTMNSSGTNVDDTINCITVHGDLA